MASVVLEQTKKNLRSVLLSEKYGVLLDRLEREYYDLLGQTIPITQLGFHNVESFLRSIPDVCSITWRHGHLTVVGVASQETAHVQEMVSKQNTTKKQSFGGGKRRNTLPPRFRGGGRRVMSRYSRNSYGWSGDEDDLDPYSGFDIMGGGKVTVPEVTKSPVIVMTATPSVVDKTRSIIMEERNEEELSVFKPRVEQLLQGRPHGLYSTQIEKMYVKSWGSGLPEGWVSWMEEECGLVVRRKGVQVENILCSLCNV